MTERTRDAFYVGYLPRAPRGLGQFLGVTTGLLLAAGVAVAVVLALSQRPPAPSVFEFGQSRTLRGVVLERPYPMLVVRRPGRGGATTSIYLLAGSGKRGAAPLVAGHGGQTMSFEAVLVYRGLHTMAEVASPADFGAVAPRELIPGPTPAVEVELTGEIVDSKCHLGAMNPGSGATHRACAVRCLRGGLPPILVLRSNGSDTEIILAGRDGRPIGRRVLGYVGVPVRIKGSLRQLGDWPILEADPWAIGRIRR